MSDYGNVYTSHVFSPLPGPSHGGRAEGHEVLPGGSTSGDDLIKFIPDAYHPNTKQ